MTNTHDDALVRALDKLYEATPWTVYSTLALHALSKLGHRLGPIHCDTTSFSLEGAYERQSNLKIAHGYSKDRRPDLKPIAPGLDATPDRLPILANIENGNTSDKTWNFTFIRRSRQTFGQDDWEQAHTSRWRMTWRSEWCGWRGMTCRFIHKPVVKRRSTEQTQESQGNSLLKRPLFYRDESMVGGRQGNGDGRGQ